MRAVQRREPEACDELVRRYYGPLCRLASGLLAGQPLAVFDAEDMVVLTLMRAWEYADTFRPGRGTVWNWLAGIAVNCCREALRREHRRQQILTTATATAQSAWRPPLLPLSPLLLAADDPESDPDHPLLPVSPSAESTFLAQLDAEERRQWVRDRLGRLTDKERERWRCGGWKV
jgi:RNA polymerase sigma factor (sigma-70 family)